MDTKQLFKKLKRSLYDYFTLKLIFSDKTYVFNFNKATTMFALLSVFFITVFSSYGYLIRPIHEEKVLKVIEQRNRNVYIRNRIVDELEKMEEIRNELQEKNDEIYAILKAEGHHEKLKELKTIHYIASIEDEYSNGKIKPLLRVPIGFPTYGTVTSGWGWRVHPFYRNRMSFHTGFDIANKRWTPIRTTAEGIVRYTNYHRRFRNYGRVVVIDTGSFQLLFAHLIKTNVRVGQKVRKGDIIGYMGSTGLSTGPHLHYEVMLNYVPVEPHKYIYVR